MPSLSAKADWINAVDRSSRGWTEYRKQLKAWLPFDFTFPEFSRSPTDLLTANRDLHWCRHPELTLLQCRLLDRALSALHKLAVKYQLPIVGARRQPPPSQGGGDDCDVPMGSGRRRSWRRSSAGGDGGVGRRWNQLANCRLSLSLSAEPTHPRAQIWVHRHGASARFASDGWAPQSHFDVVLPVD